MKEEYLASSHVSARQTYNWLGLTDTATLSLKKNFLIISDDFPLYQHALKLGFDAINFNHVRFA